MTDYIWLFWDFLAMIKKKNYALWCPCFLVISQQILIYWQMVWRFSEINLELDVSSYHNSAFDLGADTHLFTSVSRCIHFEFHKTHLSSLQNRWEMSSVCGICVGLLFSQLTWNDSISGRSNVMRWFLSPFFFPIIHMQRLILHLSFRSSLSQARSAGGSKKKSMHAFGPQRVVCGGSFQKVWPERWRTKRTCTGEHRNIIASDRL